MNNEELIKEFIQYVEIIQRLRGDQGCPWDKKQTNFSLKKELRSEVYEVLDAIDNRDKDNLKEEIGDVYLVLGLLASINQDNNQFNWSDIFKGLNEKLIRRHPHVFGNVKVNSVEEVLINWNNIKEEEKKEKPIENENSALLKKVPHSYDPLEKAFSYQKLAATKGFDWPSIEGVILKIQEELKEIEEALALNDSDKIEEEIGDLFFILVNFARWHNVRPFDALARANRKFAVRFAYVEESMEKNNLEWKDLATMDSFWNEAKKRAINILRVSYMEAKAFFIHNGIKEEKIQIEEGKGNIYYALAHADGSIITLVVVNIKQNIADILEIITIPEEENKGYASLMVRFLMDEMKVFGCSELYALVLPYAIKKYMEWGFQNLGESFDTRKNLNAFKMGLFL